jgi:uncharacterized protein YheU (UPF0270 family)
MIIDHTQLDPDTLYNLLLDIVTRDGTDYGAEEISVEEKISNLRNKLNTGECMISYDETTESCGLVNKHDSTQ